MTVWLGLVALLSLSPLTSAFCPPLCSCDDSTLLVDCHLARNLRMVPIFLNPQTKFLSLAQNQITEISMSLQFYSELSLLDFSQNQVGSLGGRNFENLRNCKVLNGSYNAVKDLEEEAFLGLKALVVLDLSANQIERISRTSFRGLSSLKELYLDRNRLEALDWDLFAELAALQRLSMRFNFIRVLEPPQSLRPALLLLSINASSGETEKALPSRSPTFWTLASLLELDLGWNQLSRVRDYGLSVLPALRDLNLCSNYIHTLEERAFVPSGGALAKLNLSQNRLGRVPTESLEKLGSSLRDLDLGGNRLSDELGPNSFRSLFQLQRLRLSENAGLTSIDPNALLDNVGLVSLEANGLSNLSLLPVGLLNNKPYLRLLSLQHAQVTAFPEELFTSPVYAHLLPSLDLTGNPLDCNCSAYPLFQYIAQLGSGEEEYQEEGSEVILLQNSTGRLNQPSPAPPSRRVSLRKLTCATPARLAQIQLGQLSSADFTDCFESYSFPQEYTEVMVILLASSILLLILLAVGIKICCVYGLCAKCRERDRLRRKEAPCDSSALDEFCTSVGRKGIGCGSNAGSGSSSIPLSPAPSKKIGPPIYYGDSNGSPVHRFPRNGTLGSRYSNGPLARAPDPGLDYDAYHQYSTISNRHPPPNAYSNNKLRFDPKMQLVLSNGEGPGGPNGAPPPIILHYEYDYPDYRSKHHTGHRVKQVPSVLV